METPRHSLRKSSFVEHFSTVPDPRKEGMCEHLLLDILLIAVLAVICGADGWDEIHDWGVGKEDLLRKMLVLPHGIPSADTFRRTFARIKPTEFERAFRAWIGELIETTARPHIAIDGKTSRGVARHSSKENSLHLVHAWSVTNRLLLGQVATAEKSNEITAIPELLKLLDLDGAVVTIDAMGCQRAIVEQIVQGGGDYVLPVKENQPGLLKAVTKLVDKAALVAPGKTASWGIQCNEGHGREEVRRLVATSAATLSVAEKWEGLRSCGYVECMRTIGDRTTTERRYFITSLDWKDDAQLLSVLRGHWSVENHLHWTLDVAFKEDSSAVHEGHGPENLSLLRKIALTALKATTTFKAGLARRRKRAGWDDRYLLEVLLAGIT